MDQWDGLTVKARWEWVRWIQFTKNPDTRSRRIEVTFSKLKAGKKRPCCFDLTRCTVTEVSNNGILR
ncbi:YdeI/OmpD-associated family protein [Fusibacter bizertensis]